MRCWLRWTDGPAQIPDRARHSLLDRRPLGALPGGVPDCRHRSWIRSPCRPGLERLAPAVPAGARVDYLDRRDAGIDPQLRGRHRRDLVVVGALAGWLAWRHRAELLDFLRRRWTVIVATEVLFLALFALWALVASEVPGINHTEKPMDFGIMNAVINSAQFPPEDQWLSGHSIAYYYGGHYVAAMLTTLSGVPSDVGYNLAMASIPAMFGAGVLGLAYNLLRLAGASTSMGLVIGTCAALAIGLLGNLSGVLEFAYVRGIGGDWFWEWIAIKGLEPPPGGQGWLPDGFWWWWRGTRVIDTLGAAGASLDYTITEFPFFSFLLGDLHAHVSALPFLMLAMAMVLSLLIAPEPPGMQWVTNHPWECGMLALTLGALAFINAWDFPGVPVPPGHGRHGAMASVAKPPDGVEHARTVATERRWRRRRSFGSVVAIHWIRGSPDGGAGGGWDRYVPALLPDI